MTDPTNSANSTEPPDLTTPPRPFLREGMLPRGQAGSGSIAVYSVPQAGDSTRSLAVAVECLDGGSNLPRDATSLRDVAVRLDLEPEFEAVVAMANIALDKLKALRPGEVKIEFGVELGGGFQIPVVVKGEGKANFKVTLTWKNQDAPQT
jgi:hypothetical protein